jgi:hypothetical protein
VVPLKKMYWHLDCNEAVGQGNGASSCFLYWLLEVARDPGKVNHVMKKAALSFVLAIAVLTSGACSGGGNDHSDTGEHHQVVGDIREETASVDILPEFLSGKHELLQHTYTAVALHQDLLEKIPCYCGCGETVGHQSSYDCFVYQNNEDGSLVWDDHGTKCNICVDIAVTSIIEYNNGKSVQEIRAMIDEMYQEGFPNPTPTPEV